MGKEEFGYGLTLEIHAEILRKTRESYAEMLRKRVSAVPAENLELLASPLSTPSVEIDELTDDDDDCASEATIRVDDLDGLFRSDIRFGELCDELLATTDADLVDLAAAGDVRKLLDALAKHRQIFLWWASIIVPARAKIGSIPMPAQDVRDAISEAALIDLGIAPPAGEKYHPWWRRIFVAHYGVRFRREYPHLREAWWRSETCGTPLSEAERTEIKLATHAVAEKLLRDAGRSDKPSSIKSIFRQIRDDDAGHRLHWGPFPPDIV
ncbi:MAG: hypothetical protein NXI30_04700 [bacterium]|nr:hypothetical protein [bacterium]